LPPQKLQLLEIKDWLRSDNIAFDILALPQGAHAPVYEVVIDVAEAWLKKASSV
jgi:hypothetical protein